jgi:hypothetical protein
MAENEWLAERFEVLSFTFADDKIAQIEVIGDPARLAELELAVLDIR